MALGVLIIVILLGFAGACYDGDPGVFVGGLFIAVMLSLMVGAIAEVIDGVDRTEYSTVERIECLHTTDGLVVLAGDRLFEDTEYVYRPDVQQIVTVYEDQDNRWSWPWMFIESKTETLEFAGCPD